MYAFNFGSVPDGRTTTRPDEPSRNRTPSVGPNPS